MEVYCMPALGITHAGCDSSSPPITSRGTGQCVVPAVRPSLHCLGEWRGIFVNDIGKKLYGGFGLIRPFLFVLFIVNIFAWLEAKLRQPRIPALALEALLTSGGGSPCASYYGLIASTGYFLLSVIPAMKTTCEQQPHHISDHQARRIECFHMPSKRPHPGGGHRSHWPTTCQASHRQTP